MVPAVPVVAVAGPAGFATEEFVVAGGCPLVAGDRVAEVVPGCPGCCAVFVVPFVVVAVAAAGA